MELKAPKSTSNFFKFETLGDVFQGRFVSFEHDVEGNFGPRDKLTLKTAKGIQTVDCTKALGGILRANEDALEDKIITVTWVDSKSTGKGNPMKVFTVDASDKIPPPAKVNRPAPSRAQIDPMENDAAEPDPF